MNVLFICNQNKNRSKTAEHLFQGEWHVRSAGLFNTKPINKATIQWADTVIVMEDFQRKELAKRFPREYLQKIFLSLNIPDIYRKNDSRLQTLLQKKITTLLNDSILV